MSMVTCLKAKTYKFSDYVILFFKPYIMFFFYSEEFGDIFKSLYSLVFQAGTAKNVSLS